jgi:STE24 endopeptidase
MNWIGVLVLLVLVADYLVGIVTDRLNLQALDSHLPEEFQDVYDSDAYARSQEYTRARTRFGWVTTTFNLVLIVSFWLVGGFGALNNWILGLGLGSLLTGLLYIGSLAAAGTVLSIPFSLYSTFGIEERFGFNKTTPKTFVMDRLKGIGLTVILGGGLLATILAFFEYAGDLAWLFCWLMVSLVTLLLQLIAPTLILPLFNRFTPLEDGDLRHAIVEFAARVGFPLENVFVMDGSKRSRKSNAFFTGFGKRKRIVLFDTLIEKHTAEELVAVLAHEVGHYKKKHIRTGVVLSILHSGLLFFLLSVVMGSVTLHEAFFVSAPTVYTGIVFFGLLYTPVEFVLSLLLDILSRRHEYQADRFASKAVGSPTPLVSALKKLSRDNLSNLTPHPVYVFLNYSHPPVLQRIRALLQQPHMSNLHPKP